MSWWAWLLSLAGTGLAVGAVDRAWRLLSRHPQAGDKPVQIASTWDGVVSLADVVAHLTATGSTVAEEFLPPADRVDRRTIAAGGLLLVPDDVDVSDSAVVPIVIRTSRPDAVRLEHGGLWSRRAGATLPGVRGALAVEAARVRRAAYDQLLRDRAARPNLGRPRPHGQADPRNLLPQAQVPGPPPRGVVRPSPGRPSRH